MQELGKVILTLGAGLVVLGLGLWVLGRLGFRGLWGDLRYESENFRLYFPIVTCLLISAMLTALLWAWRWFHRP